MTYLPKGFFFVIQRPAGRVVESLLKARKLLILSAVILVLSAGCPSPQGEQTTNATDVPQFGVAYSPRGYPGASSDADVRAFFAAARDAGGIVAFHTNWRDSKNSAGEIPKVVQFAHAAEKEFGIIPAVGFGWTVGEQPDLTSASEPKNNTWRNAETRKQFRDMVVKYAAAHKPRFLFLGNETNGYRAQSSQADWDTWMSEFKETYEAVKKASPSSVVFTTFQLERLKGLGKKNGWSGKPQWNLLGDFKGAADAMGFTSYPYFEYDKAGDMPDDYYGEIKKYWSGPVIFTEIGWLAKNSGPYRGSGEAQADFVKRFFELTRDLDVKYAAWLFLHDLDKAPPAFDGIGLRAKDGTPRPAEATWQNAVAERSGR